jgi:outer membrane protein assembly factor BamB
MTIKTIVGLVALALSAPAMALAGDTWPGWRGPTGLGVSDERDLPLTWGGPTNDNIVWKSLLPGAGAKGKSDHNQSSPIVWKDRVCVVAAYWPEGVAQSEFPEHHVACYSAAEGKLLWDVKAPPGPWLLKDLRGGYAAPTPCTDGERVYVLFGSSELAALDFDGRLLWRKEVTPYAWDVAVGTSPILTRDAVLVLADGTKPALSRLIAFDRASGNIKWERKRPEANFNHTTPVLIEVNGNQQLVIASSGALQGVSPINGEIIWWANNKGDVPTPAYGNGLVYSEDGRGGPGIAVDPTGTGDVTATKVKWTTRPIPEGYSSPTIAGGYVYRAHSPGILNCFALATGKPAFAERLPNGFITSASPVLTADGRLYFASGGKSIVLPVGPKFEPLAINDLGDGGAASPAVAHGRLYLKGSKYLYCIGKPGRSP